MLAKLGNMIAYIYVQFFQVFDCYGFQIFSHNLNWLRSAMQLTGDGSFITGQGEPC